MDFSSYNFSVLGFVGLIARFMLLTEYCWSSAVLKMFISWFFLSVSFLCLCIQDPYDRLQLDIVMVPFGVLLLVFVSSLSVDGVGLAVVFFLVQYYFQDRQL